MFIFDDFDKNNNFSIKLMMWVKNVKKINFKTNSPYEILIDTNLMRTFGDHIKKISSARQVLIITDDVVNELYSGDVTDSLIESGFEVFLFTLTHGESSKTLQSVERIYSFLIKNKFTRSDLIIALGGGIVGDIAGFVAATYMRGIDLVQIPTTLLAQIDSAIGGKNGVNLAHGKNLIGTFYQPKLVLIDIGVLSTLPKQSLSDGMAEAIKYGLIRSESLFNMIKNCELDDILTDLIFECISIKQELVERDELEQGERKLLNFGHTLGHAIEKFYNFSKYTHGQAVAIGMACTVRSGENLAITKSGTYEELTSVLRKYNLPCEIDCDMDKLAEIAKIDKKATGEFFDIVLIKSIGAGFVKRIKKDDLKKYIGG